MPEQTNNNADRRAEDAFRRGLDAYADAMPIPDLTEGLAAVVGQGDSRHVADAGSPMAARSDSSRPEMAPPRPSGPSARPSRTSHRRRWIAAVLVLVVVIGVGVPLAVRALLPGPAPVDAVPARTPAPTVPSVITPTPTPTPPGTTAANALEALLLTDEDMPKGTTPVLSQDLYQVGSLSTAKQATMASAAPAEVDCGYDPLAIVAPYLASHAKERAGLLVATGTYVFEGTVDSTETLLADPDKGILNALTANLTLCEKGHKITAGYEKGTTRRWRAVQAGSDVGVGGPVVKGLTYVEVSEDALPGSDPGMPVWFAFGHVSGVTLVAQSDAIYTGTSFFNAAYTKMVDGSATSSPSVAPTRSASAANPKDVPCPKGPAVPSVVKSACKGSVSAVPAQDGPGGWPSFITPSANIGCDMYPGPGDATPGEVRCDILQATFAMPPKPKDPGCPNWVPQGTSLVDASPASAGLCAGDPTIAGSTLMNGGGDTLPVLAYGSSLVYGNFACTSAMDGLTCWNTATNHGFKLSKSTRLVW